MSRREEKEQRRKMFSGNVRTSAPIWKNEGEFIGSRYVKKAGMTITYKNFNKKGQSDIQSFS